MSWDSKFFQLAGVVASWSKDRSRKFGSIIVDKTNNVRAIGYNGFPRGVNDDVPSRHDRPAKYLWTVHSEVNALLSAARSGVALDGCRIYVPWYPCANCAGSLIQAGIVEVVCLEPNWDDASYKESFAVTKVMFEEAGVVVRFEGKNDCAPAVLTTREVAPPALRSVYHTAYVDGGSRGNPGPASVGAVIRFFNGATFDHSVTISEYIGEATNNVAEYTALLKVLGLDKLQEDGVTVYSDSKLMVNQINGLYECKAEGLIPLHTMALRLINRLPRFRIVHIPREENTEADALCNQALDEHEEQIATNSRA